MTQKQLTDLIMKELDRQQIYLFDYEDLASVGIDGHLNVIELAQAILKGQSDLIAALKRASDYIDNCGAQAGAQAALDDIESVLKAAGSAS